MTELRYRTAVTREIATNGPERAAYIARLTADLPTLLARNIPTGHELDLPAARVRYSAYHVAGPGDEPADPTEQREQGWTPGTPLPDWAQVVIVWVTVLTHPSAPRPEVP